jgi:hypothetical protein
MAKSWKDLDIKSIANESAKETDDKLAAEISSLTRLKDEEIKKWFPEKGDVAKLAELMQIVNSADARNKKVNQIVENSEKLAGVILTLLSKLV